MNISEVKSEFRNLVDELKTSISSENEVAVQKINDRMDTLELAVKKSGEDRPLSESEVKQARTAEFRKAHDMFVRGQRNEIAGLEFKHLQRKADSMVRFDFGSAGALLLPDEFGEGIIKNVVESTPVLQLARVTRVNASNYKRRRRVSTPGGVWLGETVSQDKKKIVYDTVDITPHKWAARYGVSLEMEDDTAFDLRSEIMEAFREDAEYDVGNVSLNGDGVGKPTGMVGRITNFDATQLAITTNDLIRMTEELKDSYQANASWLFTRKTRAYIRTLILSATNGLQYTWEPNFQTGAPTLLLGAPVYVAREGDLAGRVTGNFTAGQVYALYGDFNRGYEFAIRTDMYMIDDIYSEASSFERNFHIMTRIGGNVIQPEALVQITAAGS